jgi:hypothetical protein
MAKYEYKPCMASEIIRMSKEGYLKCEIASALGVPASQLSKWRREYDDFADVIELSETHSMAWWAMRGRTNLDNPRFNFYVWYAIMKNAYGWADKPTERNIEIEDWKGDFVQKINQLDQALSTGKCSPDMYEKMMKSLNAHANINEIIYVQPKLCQLELDKQLANGEISPEEHDIKLGYLDHMNKIRELAAENIFKEEKFYSKFNHKQARKVPKEAREKKKEELENTEVIIEEKAINPAFEQQTKEMRERRMKRLGINSQDKECISEDNEE